MTLEIIFRIIEIILQVILVILAGMALFTWKMEIRGRDRYRLARELLAYIKDLRFFINSKNNSWHQIYLNDILVDKNKFYNNQLSSIGKEEVYFDQSIFGLFSHINPRSDVFLPKRIRILLDELYPHSGKRIADMNKNLYTYIQLGGVKKPNIIKIDGDKDPKDGIYKMFETKGLTIKDYFMKWEKLIIELQKLI